jgi:hypothetical protein
VPIKSLLPYLAPLLVLFIMYRRIGRVRRVRVSRLWLPPLIILLAGGSALYYSGLPTPLWAGAWLLAAVAGAAIGYLRASHTHLSVHPETGEVQSTQTAAATAIIMGLFVVKFGLNLVFPQLNGGQRPSAMSAFTPDTIDAVQAAHQVSHTATNINYATDTLLIFSIALLVASALETWLRAQRLLAAHRGETGEVTE